MFICSCSLLFALCYCRTSKLPFLEGNKNKAKDEVVRPQMHVGNKYTAPERYVNRLWISQKNGPSLDPGGSKLVITPRITAPVGGSR
jgi:hypothetical protein